jgi:phasin family protein
VLHRTKYSLNCAEIAQYVDCAMQQFLLRHQLIQENEMTNSHAPKGASVDAGKVAGLFHVPSFDFEAVIASQRKMIEALMEANKLAIEGAQAVMRHQFEVGRQAMDHFSTMVRDFSQMNGSVQDRVAKQAEYSKQAIAKGLSNARETSELATKAGTQALTVVSKRVTESLDEARNYTKKRSAA